jgi:hypothetical protein
MVATYEGRPASTRVLAIYQPRRSYGPAVVGIHDLAFPIDSPHRDAALPLCTDIASGAFAVREADAWR